jgi:hypothetical protein
MIIDLEMLKLVNTRQSLRKELSLLLSYNTSVPKVALKKVNKIKYMKKFL